MQNLFRRIQHSRAIVSAILFVLSVALVFISGSANAAVLSPSSLFDLVPASVDDFETAEEMVGQYVEMEVNFIWEPYCYVGDTEETATEMQYMVALHKITDMEQAWYDTYIAVSVTGEKIAAMEELYERGNIAYSSEDAADLGASVIVRGIVDTMDSTEVRFYRELAASSGMDDSQAVELILRDGVTPAPQKSDNASQDSDVFTQNPDTSTQGSDTASQNSKAVIYFGVVGLALVLAVLILLILILKKLRNR